MAAVAEGTAIDGQAVLAALGGLNFQISTNAGTYAPEKMISGYVQSIFTALDSLSNSWKSAVQFVSEYVSNFTGVPLPGAPEGNTGFLSVQYGSPVSASLTGVNTTLNVRSAASATAGIIGSVAAGSTISKVLGEETSDGNKWYYIETEDGQKGYVDSNYVNLSETPEIVDSSTNTSNQSSNTTTQQTTMSTETSTSDDSTQSTQSYDDSGSTSYSSGGSSSSSYSSSSSGSSASSSSSGGYTGGSGGSSSGSSGYTGGSGGSSSGGSSGSTSTPTKTPTSEQESKTGLVSIKYSNSNLNVRKTPEMSDSNIIGTLDRGTVINVINDDGKSEFVQIKLENGDIAYVAREYISFPSNPSSISRVTTQDPSGNLNVRLSPNGEIVDFLKNQASVEVIGPSEVPGWTKIRLNGEERYVATEYLK